jgi:type III secretion protein U
VSGDTASKTEKPTPKKLRDARQKGQVAKSKEVASTLSLLVAACYFWIGWDWLMEVLKETVLLPASVYGLPFEDGLQIVTHQVITSALYWIVIPFVAVLFVFTVIANVAQFGFLLAFDPIIPKMEKVNPASGFKRIFSKKSLGDTGLSVLKIIAISVVVSLMVYDALAHLVHDISNCDIDCQTALMQNLTWRLIAYLVPLLLAITIIDIAMQKAFFIKEQMMSKQEVKREHKDAEGDPLIRGKRKQEHKELVMNSLEDKLKASRVLITDVDKCIAVRYEQGVTPLPLIMAIGRKAVARQMVKVAKQEKLPVVEDAAVVNLLIDEGRIGQYIPDIAIGPVAQILRKLA